jgi:cephalosporin hydroxylase
MDAEERKFSRWKREAETHFLRIFQLHMNDMPDWTWRMAFEDGVSPREAVIEYLNEEALEYLEVFRSFSDKDLAEIGLKREELFL